MFHIRYILNVVLYCDNRTVNVSFHIASNTKAVFLFLLLQLGKLKKHPQTKRPPIKSNNQTPAKKKEEKKRRQQHKINNPKTTPKIPPKTPPSITRKTAKALLYTSQIIKI